MIKYLLVAGFIFLIIGCNNITMDFPDLQSTGKGQEVSIVADLELSPDVIVIPGDSVIKYFLHYSLPNNFHFKPEIMNSFPVKAGSLILSEFDYFKHEYVKNVISRPDEVVFEVKQVSFLDLIDNFELIYSIPLKNMNDSLINQVYGDSLNLIIYDSPLALFYKRYENDYSIKFNSYPDVKFSGHIFVQNHQLKFIRCETTVSEDAGLFFTNKNPENNYSFKFPMVRIPVQLILNHQNIKIPLDLTLSNEIQANGLKTGHFAVESSLHSDYTASLIWTPDLKDKKNFDGVINFSRVSFFDGKVFGSVVYKVNLDIQFNKIPFLTHTYSWTLKTSDKGKYEQYVNICFTDLKNEEENEAFSLVSIEK